jgi:protein subunit release factor B
MTRKLLFSVTAADCDWSYTKGSGAGGQKRNKTSSAVHCTHRDSGAHGYSEASRSQHDNKSDAFVKMAGTKEFKSWHQREVWKHLGVLEDIERSVKEGMDPRNLRLEVKVDGRWVEVPFDSITLDGNEVRAEV